MAERNVEPVNKIIPVAASLDPYLPAAPSASAGKDLYVPRRDGARPSMEVLADNDPVERSGQAVVALMQKAAEATNIKADRARDLTHKLSAQLRAAEDRMRELEPNMRHYQDRAQRSEERAQRVEKWLVRIYKEIEEKFFEQKRAPDR